MESFEGFTFAGVNPDPSLSPRVGSLSDILPHTHNHSTAWGGLPLAVVPFDMATCKVFRAFRKHRYIRVYLIGEEFGREALVRVHCEHLFGRPGVDMDDWEHGQVKHVARGFVCHVRQYTRLDISAQRVEKVKLGTSRGQLTKRTKSYGKTGVLGPTASLETQTKVFRLLLLRRDLPLRRDRLLLLLFWLHLRRMGAAVRYIMPQRRSQLLAVVGEDLRVVCAWISTRSAVWPWLL